MTTYELIQAAEAAILDDQQAVQQLQAATVERERTQAALLAANQALYDDLSANGPACVVDDSSDPPTVWLYSAAEPAAWQKNEIRVAA
jgi:hypothetical protein